jgi:hypothetical protein
VFYLKPNFEYEGLYQSNALNFFSYNSDNIEIYLLIHMCFAIIRLFSHKVFVIFNTVLPTLSKTLYTTAVKFPASISAHITKILFQFVVICRMASTQSVPYRTKQVTSRRAPDLGCEQDGEEQSVPFLRLAHVCTSWREVGHCREGEGRLSCFGQDELYG